MSDHQQEIIHSLKKWKSNSVNGGTALCPFHSDNTPSFGVNFSINAFHCFSCGAKGTIAQLCKHLQILYTPPQHTKDGTANRSIKTKKFLKKLDLRDNTITSQEIYLKIKHMKDKHLDPRNNPLFEYIHPFLEDRDISPYMKNHFHIRYDTITEAIFIPIFNDKDEIVANARRYKNPIGKMKYKYTKGFALSKNFYNINKHIGQNTVLITEGIFDCLRAYEYFHTSQIENLNRMKEYILPISTFSVTNFTKNHIKILKDLFIKNVILFYDNDKAGMDGIEAMRKFIKKNKVIGLQFYSLNYELFPKDAKDLNELSEQEVLLLLENIIKL